MTSERADALNAAARRPVSQTTGRRSGAILGGGVDGNGRLTAITGAILFVLLAVIGVTILRVHQLITVHLFVGLLLIGPVVVKLASTGYRFARYYTANSAYRRKGPPELAMRVLAPFVIASTIAVFASGVALLVTGPDTTLPLKLIHKASFIVWVAVTAVHVLGHLGEMSDLLSRPRVRRAEFSLSGNGRTGRAIATAGGLVGGTVLAVLLIPDFGAWASQQAFHLHQAQVGRYGP